MTKFEQTENLPSKEPRHLPMWFFVGVVFGAVLIAIVAFPLWQKYQNSCSMMGKVEGTNSFMFCHDARSDTVYGLEVTYGLKQ